MNNISTFLKTNHKMRYLSNIYGFCLYVLFFTVFPFGQLLRYETSLFGINIAVHVIDLISLASICFIFSFPKERIFRYLGKLLLVFIASWIFSLILFEFTELIRGLYYLLRLVSYFSFAAMIYMIARNTYRKKLLLNIMYASITCFMLFGIYQFIYYFDLRDLYYVGWDDHLFRLTSTLFDPGYSAGVLIIGLIVSLKIKIFRYNMLNRCMSVLYTFAVILTFSRAGYIATVVVYLYLYKKQVLKILTVGILIVILLLIIPKPNSSGVELYRMFSIQSRLGNYKNTIGIILEAPLFGVGFNNICSYKTINLGVDNKYSHSCSGSDSSVLMVLATTGIIGIVTFTELLIRSFTYNRGGIYIKLWKVVAMSLLVGSFFNNSLFYNFIMGLFAVFTGLTRRTIIRSNKV